MTEASENPANKYFRPKVARVRCAAPGCVGGLQGFSPFSDRPRRIKCTVCHGCGAVDDLPEDEVVTAIEATA